MQLKTFFKRVVAVALVFVFLMSTQVHAAEGEEPGKLDINAEGYEIALLNPEEITYTGEAQKPEFKVVKKDESEAETTLDAGNYDAVYTDNTNAGTAKITVKGNEEAGYTGEITKEFTINPVSLKDAVVTSVDAKVVYNGKAVTPAVTVNLGEISLKEGVDFKVSYKNNNKVGTADVIVTGIGNYKDTAAGSFEIVPGTSGITAKAAYNKITLTWKKIPGVTGYRIYRSTAKDGEYKRIKTITSSSTVKYENTNVALNQNYYYKLRAYRMVGDKTVYGEYSDVVNAKAKVGISSVKSAKSASTTKYSAATVTWSKVAGANGYRVYRSKSLDGTYKALKTVKGVTSYTDKTTVCGNKYYYKVRAYRVSKDKKYFGDYSKAKSVRVRPGRTKIDPNSEGYQNKVILEWEKVYGASGYEIYRAKTKTGTYRRVTTIKSRKIGTYTDTGLRKSQIYYYKIRAYRTVDGKKVYGSFSPRFKKGIAGWRYINGLKLYYNSKGKLVKDVSGIIGKQASYVIKINKQRNVVTVYAKDGNKGYIIPVKSFVCSTGVPTPVGTFYTPAKYRWHTLMGPCYGQWCTRIHKSFLFHSVFYSTRSNSTLSTTAYNKLGTTCSHGCVRLRAGDAKWIYDNCKLRTKVIIYNSAYTGPFGKPSAAKLASWHRWDPTDPTAKYKCKAHGCHQ